MQYYPKTLSAKDIRNLVGESPVMLEVGCHDGTPPDSHTLTFLEAMPGIRLYCFEPDPRPAARFRKLIGDDPRVTFYEQAVGDINGLKEWNASGGQAGGREDWDLSGSLQKPTEHLVRSPEITFTKAAPVKCVRLDTWHRLNWHKGTIDCAWCDLQGGQRAFLAGAQDTLPFIRYMYIESHSTPLYENEPTQEELITLLPDFEPLGIYERDNILFKYRTP